MKRTIFTMLTIFSICLTTHALAATYYVSISGDDSNPGTFSNPWRTIQKAANTMVAGDKAIVNAGTYNKRVSESTSGTSGSRIVYEANGTVTCQGFELTGNYLTVDGFNVENGGIYVPADYVTVQNCTITEAYYRSILLAPSADHCTVDNCTIIRGTGDGIWMSGTHNIIKNCDISDTRCSTGSGADADGICAFGNNHTIQDNYIHDINFTNNPGCNPHIDAIQTWNAGGEGAALNNSIIERNHIRFTEAPVGAQCLSAFMLEGGVDSIVIRNNIIEVNASAIYLNESAQDTEIYNNTFIGDPEESTAVAIRMEGTDGTIIKNNIICDFRNRHIYISPYQTNTNYDIDYNCKYNSDNSDPGGQEKQTHDVWKQDPKFVNYDWSGSGGNYHLQSDSPCIDTGVTIPGVSKDHDGTSRPKGMGFDIGAYEFGIDPDPPSPPSGVTIM